MTLPKVKDNAEIRVDHIMFMEKNGSPDCKKLEVPVPK